MLSNVSNGCRLSMTEPKQLERHVRDLQTQGFRVSLGPHNGLGGAVEISERPYVTQALHSLYYAKQILEQIKDTADMRKRTTLHQISMANISQSYRIFNENERTAFITQANRVTASTLIFKLGLHLNELGTRAHFNARITLSELQVFISTHPLRDKIQPLIDRLPRHPNLNGNPEPQQVDLQELGEILFNENWEGDFSINRARIAILELILEDHFVDNNLRRERNLQEIRLQLRPDQNVEDQIVQPQSRCHRFTRSILLTAFASLAIIPFSIALFQYYNNSFNDVS